MLGQLALASPPKCEGSVEARVWAQKDRGFGDLSKGHHCAGNLSKSCTAGMWEVNHGLGEASSLMLK